MPFLPKLLLCLLAFLPAQAWGQKVSVENFEKDFICPAVYLIGTWEGTFTQYSYGINESYPMKLVVDRVEGCKFFGTIHWPDQNGQTKMEGQVRSDGKIDFTETKILKGDNLVLYGHHITHRGESCHSLAGKWWDQSMTTQGAHFSLQKQGQPGTLHAVKRRIASYLGSTKSPTARQEALNAYGAYFFGCEEPFEADSGYRQSFQYFDDLEQAPQAYDGQASPEGLPFRKVQVAYGDQAFFRFQYPTESQKPSSDRKVVAAETIRAQSPTIRISIWDNEKLDGDRVSLRLNQRPILEDYELKKRKKTLSLRLQPGINRLVLHAENLGGIPPNTATFEIAHGGKTEVYTLNSNLSRSEAIVLKWEKP